MHAVTFVGDDIRWMAHPDPVAGTGELVVAVRAAGMNQGDLLQRRGLYPAPPGSPPDIPGLEFAGEVIALGPSVERFGVGDRVMGVVGGGAQAEQVVIHERCALPIPEGIPDEQAGGFAEVFTTAHDALFTQCGLSMGERVGITGAAGGVGTAAVQLAVAAGADVVASVRTRSCQDPVAALGATVTDAEDFWDAGPFDVILELIGGPNLDADVKALTTGGRIVVIGAGGGAKGQVNVLALMGARGSIHASTLRARPLEGKAAAARAAERHVLPLLADGRVRVPIHATHRLEDAAEAYEDFAGGGKVGKIVLTASD